MVSRSTVTQVWSISINTILVTSISTKRTLVHIYKEFLKIHYSVLTITMMMISIECITIVTWTIVATNSIMAVLLTSSVTKHAFINILCESKIFMNVYSATHTCAIVTIQIQTKTIFTCTIVTSNIVMTVLFTSTIICFAFINIFFKWKLLQRL